MSRSRKFGGNKGSLFKQAVVVVVIGACIIGFFGIPARPDAHAFPAMIVSKSETVKAWMQNCAPNAIHADFSKCSLAANVQGGATAPASPAPTK